MIIFQSVTIIHQIVYHLVHYHLNKHGGKINYLEVSVLNIMDLCKNDIDILFIDTEGSEYEILSSISFNQVCISTICVESCVNNLSIPLLFLEETERTPGLFIKGE